MRRRAALLLVLWAGTVSAAEPAPRVVVEPERFDFGAARQERTLSTQFTIRNHGDAELVLGPIASDCSCTAALLGSHRVAPGGSTALRVSLETRKSKGPVERKVVVATNDERRPRLELKVAADVKPAR